ncbi:MULTISPECIES: hypothetical protein [Streptomyces]|uniref:Uncharacterized protein n=1 Tax=Streptomyces venezuelae (strain ATCC 10712 / CBS 650.69 / DSM 40230 / JCM 4526 / NBRC 13096 / PD 04745) TaxID=953739 RepID=F2REU3_STRVP|nr:hypothetical protein [Streptomyces venezuelae]APE25076.1 hypothetical protein vnz_31285 [Streptomyces venezuelae]QES02416.1 hypothetical protein DEJ43_31785 [Streptomyces venezuelae ATCC 10712]QES09405.1 hypothetical protein DEJ44_29740 [Streptomyces venezuelae]QES11939.1 hypothetical protein DEJ45_05730 [Streptomyces venezuelae]CCA59628.1 hypothetical protein SC5C7.11 [Streptomyces venezuelae ATCC 10712]
MDDVRVAAIASLTPLEELDSDPFLVDTRGQYAVCARWADEKGYVVARQLLFYGLRPDHAALWVDVEAGAVDLFVAANERVLARALTSVPGFRAECARRGVRVETACPEGPACEPVYDTAAKAGVHRRLSMPTAGYDGS